MGGIDLLWQLLEMDEGKKAEAPVVTDHSELPGLQPVPPRAQGPLADVIERQQGQDADTAVALGKAFVLRGGEGSGFYGHGGRPGRRGGSSSKVGGIITAAGGQIVSDEKRGNERFISAKAESPRALAHKVRSTLAGEYAYASKVSYDPGEKTARFQVTTKKPPMVGAGGIHAPGADFGEVTHIKISGSRG